MAIGKDNITHNEYTLLMGAMNELKANQKEINNKLDAGFEKVTNTMQNHEGRIQAIELKDKYKSEAKTNTKWSVNTVITVASLLIAFALMIKELFYK